MVGRRAEVLSTGDDCGQHWYQETGWAYFGGSVKCTLCSLACVVTGHLCLPEHWDDTSSSSRGHARASLIHEGRYEPVLALSTPAALETEGGPRRKRGLRVGGVSARAVHDMGSLGTEDIA
jgi:hypothetical protein